MRWLNPWALLGLFAIALPVLVHLFSRRQARVVPFPTLQFLSASRLLPTRRTRLSDVPLLVLRAAIVALAALALAQPLLSPNAGPSLTPNTLARAIIVQTDRSLVGLSTAAYPARVEQVVAALEDSSTTHLRIPASAPYDALAGAVAWLRSQSGLAEIVVVSDFLQGALDSTDIATIPTDIGVAFRRIPAASFPRSERPDRSIGHVLWLSDAPTDTTDAIRRAVQRVSGLGAADIRALRVRRAYVDTIRALLADSLPTIIIASPVAVSSTPWTSTIRVTSWTSWMGTTLVSLARDSTIASAAAAVTTALADTVFATTSTVLSRSSTGVALSAASAVRVDQGPPLLLIASRLPAAHVHSAALLLAASRLVGQPAAERSGEQQRALSDDALAAWKRVPSTQSERRQAKADDTDAGASNGRQVWIAVLLLLVLEWIMRRRVARISTAASQAGQA